MKVGSSVGVVAAVVGLGAAVPACSDPVAPLPDGAVYFVLDKGTHANCPPGRTLANIPSVKGVAQTVSSSGAADKVQGSGATVDHCGSSPVCCRVAGGGPYDVQATLAASSDSGATSISFSATIADGQADAKGTVSVYTTSIASTYEAPTTLPCTFSVAAPKGEGYGIAAGRAWGTFHCDTVTDPSVPDAACALDGTFLLENCAQ